MAQRVSVELIDDLDSSPAGETLTFGLDGVDYQIDLNEFHAGELRGLFGPYIQAGRKVRASRGTDRRRGPRAALDYDPAAVRAWAASNGVTVSPRGRIAASVVEQYHAAGY
ncbi:MAG: Lsr2 family protein [Bifidobacteriaceae bacterium]|jgi:hypothetical protein|nr:Lsr2 family protein [Bifidobacteriaceae bacterium]